MKKLLKFVLLCSLTCILACTLGSAQARAKRLILKDGSYQLATQWEIKGDRVRFYSAERYAWEELPKSLIDWDATNRYQQDRAAGKALGDAQAQADSAAEAKEDESRSPTVAPGLRLPESGGIFLLDNFHQRRQLLELIQNGSEVNRHTGKNILRAVVNPLPSGPRQTIELQGLRAAVQSHTSQPELFVDVTYSDNGSNSQTSASTAAKPSPTQLDRFKIVRLQKKENEKVRVVSNMKIALTGRITQQENVVPSTTQALSSEWVKLVPSAPLEPGEYAVVEMLGPKEMNLYVWDFGVDPSAAANPAAWKPEPPKKLETGTDESPMLNKRPKANPQPQRILENPRSSAPLVTQQPLKANANPSGVVRVGPNVRELDPGYYTPDPEYTEIARAAKVEGTVVLHVIIGPDGIPREISVIQPLGWGLDEQSVKAVRTWRFPIAKKNRQPVEVPVNIEVNFRL